MFRGQSCATRSAPQTRKLAACVAPWDDEYESTTTPAAVFYHALRGPRALLRAHDAARGRPALDAPLVPPWHPAGCGHRNCYPRGDVATSRAATVAASPGCWALCGCSAGQSGAHGAREPDGALSVREHPHPGPVQRVLIRQPRRRPAMAVHWGGAECDTANAASAVGLRVGGRAPPRARPIFTRVRHRSRRPTTSWRRRSLVRAQRESAPRQ